MDIQKLKLVYFSPTGTTKKVLQNIAKGIDIDEVEQVDITRPSVRQNSLNVPDNELLVVGVPVYMGRVPALLSDWFHSIKAKNTPTVCVVVYGNRDYDNALLELKDLLSGCGCKTIAGAAFIGEHSFSSAELPSSVGRPDTRDTTHAEKFGRKIQEKLQLVSSGHHIPGITVPGDYPYGCVTDIWHVDFIAVNDHCIQCSICADGCPAGAIDSADSTIINIDKCILCCACIKHCPQNAKSMKPGLMKEAAIRCTKFIERKEPELFL